MIGSLLYLCIYTRPDIALAVSEISRFVTNPWESHWKALNHLLIYVKGTQGYGLCYTCRRKGSGKELQIYVDASWANCVKTRRSTTGVVAYLGNHSIDWNSSRQTLVAHSTAEDEYIAADSAVRMKVWLRLLLEYLGLKQESPTVIHEDNATCIVLSGGEGKFLQSKHISIRYHYLQENIGDKSIVLKFIQTDDQLADILTKPPATIKFSKFREHMVGERERTCQMHEEKLGETKRRRKTKNLT